MQNVLRKIPLLGVLLFLQLIASNLQGADWPMYRADAAHSGYTPEHLSADLEVHWIRKADHPPQPAWSGRDTRMPYDLAFQPVIARGLVFYGSSADCTVYALAAQTGRIQWTFVTDGPIRFAPVVWQNRLFVASDDGHLYCLALQDGKLLWKKRGGPNQEMILGNGRLISRWPARGGPVVKDGIVYFGAGIWPSEGIYLYALDASTGRVLWKNSSSGSLILEQPHGGNRAQSGVSIQGYLAVADNSLVVPTGRATPAVFNRDSGTFRYFHLGELGGGWGQRKGAGPFVTFLDKTLFVAEDDVFYAKDGRFLARGLPVSSTAVLPDVLVFTRGHEIKAIRKSSLWVEESDPNAPPRRKLSFEKIAWSIACEDPVGATAYRASLSNSAADWPLATLTTNPPLIVAGRTVVAATLNSKVVIADMESKAVATKTHLDGLALGLAVANQALYVSTDKGTIYCLVPANGKTPKIVNDQQVRNNTENSTDVATAELYAKTAQEIVAVTDIGSDSYCVDLGCGDGSLTHALARASQFHILAIDEDPEQVAQARKKLKDAGLLGPRVTVMQRDLSHTGFPARFAPLVVSGRSVTDETYAVPAKEMKRLLHPYHGVALMGKPGHLQKTRGQPLAGTGEWTHQYADAANSLCSADSLARGPLRMRWFHDLGIPMPSRHGRGPAPLCSQGIMIIEGLHTLHGVDAYSGRLLWSYDLKDILKPYDQEHLVGTAGTGSNMCLGENSVFVRQNRRCLRINMKTGKLIQTYCLPDEGGVWGFIAYEDGVLYGTQTDPAYIVRQLFRKVSIMTDMFTQSRSLFALDAETGEHKWVYQARASLRHNAIAMGDRRVYLIDKPKEVVDLPDNEQTPAVHQAGVPMLVCLDAKTGAIQWEQSTDIYGTTLAVNTRLQVLLMSYQYSQRSYQLPSEKGDRLSGFRSTDGKRLWDTRESYISRPIINGPTVYAQPYAYDLLTGTRHQDFKMDERQPGGCGPVSGSTHLLLYRSGTLGYTDLRVDARTQNYGPVRPGCWINAIVAGGLVLMPDATDRCTCSYLMKASIALGPADGGH